MNIIIDEGLHSRVYVDEGQTVSTGAPTIIIIMSFLNFNVSLLKGDSQSDRR